MGTGPSGRMSVNPFWQNDEVEKRSKKYLKTVFKWIKFIIYTFFMVMGLWGCFQSFVDYTVVSSRSGNAVSAGFEIGTNNHYHHLLNGKTMNYFTVNSASDAWEYGPFVFLFIYPLSWITSQLIHAMGVSGGSVFAAILIVTIVVRVLQMSITLKSVFAQERMNLLTREQARIKAKYEGKTDPHSRQKMQLETMALYKKHKINPLSSFGQIFVTTPLLIMVSRMITANGDIKNTPIWKWNLSESMLSGIRGGNWSYVILLVILLPLQFVQFQLPQYLSKKRNKNKYMDKKAIEQYKKSTRMMKFIPIMMSIFAFLMSSGIAIYWIISSLMMMGQTLMVHKITLKQQARARSK